MKGKVTQASADAGRVPEPELPPEAAPCPACGWEPTVTMVYEVVVDSPEQAANRGARCDPERGHISAGEGKRRGRPMAGDREQLAEPVPGHRSFRRQQQGDIAVALGAEPIEGAPLSGDVR